MSLTAQDLAAIDAIVARRLAAAPGEAGPRAHPALIEPLTVHEFACCIGRGDVYVRRKIRLRQIEAKGPPYLIQPGQLAKFGVPVDLAAERLLARGLRTSAQLFPRFAA